ncbi:hypothetical protein LGL08_01865 [Clostridium estertheticum]|uniref:hypothetical protein n=1 Tax=Clostridium estertheticum TaxID=238834 RepID=UPI001CF1144F|nr:hypothetical protein [Clostridium estertheticum]MCB2307140.1 hypothetical protein [Clostridium estertheticum]MCB2344068.1 hypothetical protein [Clostridium estertheticum]MCB2348318.1 hypothetical protein [Clostridium estertheticum]WAG45949.1 hypothetical protein LL127_20960 [Clostridium estertheticum]
MNMNMDTKQILSTGVLIKEPKTVSAVITLVNLDRCNTDKVIIEVWDWTSYNNPVKLPVLIGENVPVIFPYRLNRGNLAVMYTDLESYGVIFYEIRIISNKDKNLIINCFGRSVPPSTSQEGNTVLQNQLVKLDLN